MSQVSENHNFIAYSMKIWSYGRFVRDSFHTVWATTKSMPEFCTLKTSFWPPKTIQTFQKHSWLVIKHGAFNKNHLQSDRVQFGKAQKTHHQKKCACENRKSKPCSSFSSILKGWFIRSSLQNAPRWMDNIIYAWCNVCWPDFVECDLNIKRKAGGWYSTRILRLTSVSPCAIF